MQQLKTKKQTAGWNYTHQRVEKNIVYLFAEFIDNAKSNYEKSGFKFDQNFIDITFNVKEGYISVIDKAEGFEIIEPLSKVGGDEQQIGQTNEHGLGMKNAMNYFGDFSAIVSERFENGRYIREFAYQIFKNEILEVAIPLKESGITGSGIYLFADYDHFSNFVKNLDFKEEIDLNFFDLKNFKIIGNEHHNYMNPSFTKRILDEITIAFPILSSFIFERYSFTTNAYSENNFKINFYAFGKEGENLVLGKTIRDWSNQKEISQPDFFTTIQDNKYNEINSFSFKVLREKLKDFKDAKFLDLLNQKDSFKIISETFENLLIDQVKEHHKKFDFSDKLRMNNNGEPRFIKYKNCENKYKLLNEFWNNNTFAKKVLEPFYSGVLSTKDETPESEYEFKFLISKLIIEDQKIKYRRDDNHGFDIDFSLFINTTTDIKNLDNVKENYKIFGDNIESLSGFKIIKNKRAIYHGLNKIDLKDNSRDICNKILTHGGNHPNRFLMKELHNVGAKTLAFPLLKGNDGVGTVSIGGNATLWSKRLFGDIIVPDISEFKTMANKSSFNNSDILSNYVLEILGQSCINVVLHLVHILDNALSKPNAKFFLNTMIEEVEKIQEKESISNINKVYETKDNLDVKTFQPQYEVSKNLYFENEFETTVETTKIPLKLELNLKSWSFDSTFDFNIENYVEFEAYDDVVICKVRGSNKNFQISKNNDTIEFCVDDIKTNFEHLSSAIQNLKKALYKEVLTKNIEKIIGF